MATQNPFYIDRGILGGDLDCAGHTLLNLDLSGLGLTKASVGLDQVDNTSDLNKPISTLTQLALNNKENKIAIGGTDQFLVGDKTWKTYGSLALQNADSNSPLLAAKALDASSAAVVAAKRNDYGIVGTVWTYIQQLGGTTPGSILTGSPSIPAANAGCLVFEGSGVGVIKTTTSNPIWFGINNVKRMRLGNGLSLGLDVDPGIGCITAAGVITASNFLGSGSTLTFSNLLISGVSGAGYIQLQPQSVPVSSAVGAFPRIYADSTNRIVLLSSGSHTFGIHLDNALISADHSYQFIDQDGQIPVIIPTASIPPNSGTAGIAGSIVADNSFLYIRTPGAGGAWRRVALLAF